MSFIVKFSDILNFLDKETINSFIHALFFAIVELND